MKKILYVFCLLPALSFAVEDIDVAMYDEAYAVEDIHVAMYDEAYQTNESTEVATILTQIESLDLNDVAKILNHLESFPPAAGPLK